MRGARPTAALALAGVALDARRAERSLRPAVVAAWSARAVLACAAGVTRTPLLAVHHDVPLSAGVAAAVRLATRRADGVVATSHAVADVLRESRAVTILHPGVDLERFTPQPPPPPEPPRALVLGALVGWKRIDLALEVAARVPGLQLTVAGAQMLGDGNEYVAALHRRAAEPDLSGRVTFPGELADPRPRSPRPMCCCTAPTPSPTGWCSSRRWRAGAPSSPPPPPGRSRSSPAAPGGCTRPGTPPPPRRRCARCSPTRMRARAARERAEHFGVEASAARFAAAVEAVASR